MSSSNINTGYFFLSCMVIIAIVYSLSYSVDVKPYCGMRRFAPMEGFSSISNANDDVRVDNYTVVNKEGAKSGCKTILGFNGLFCDPNAESIKVDPFVDAPGDINVPNHFGLTNSKGELQLNDSQVALLRTRGGNSTGRDSQIGH